MGHGAICWVGSGCQVELQQCIEGKPDPFLNRVKSVNPNSIQILKRSIQTLNYSTHLAQVRVGSGIDTLKVWSLLLILVGVNSSLAMGTEPTHKQSLMVLFFSREVGTTFLFSCFPSGFSSRSSIKTNKEIDESWSIDFDLFLFLFRGI